MTDATLFRTWYLALSIAAVIVLVTAVLLLLVVQAARRIERLAAQALDVVKEIQTNTEAIWDLQQTNETAAQLREAARLIERHVTEVRNTLHEPESHG